jgi:hypothetical protein
MAEDPQAFAVVDVETTGTEGDLEWMALCPWPALGDCRVLNYRFSARPSTLSRYRP